MAVGFGAREIELSMKVSVICENSPGLFGYCKLEGVTSVLAAEYTEQLAFTRH